MSSDDREYELISQMYDQLWDSIQRVESGVWSFIAAYATIAVSVILGANGVVSIYYAGIFSIIVSLWGMNISVVSARWFRRNLNQVANIEQKIFDRGGMGEILPEYYMEPSHNIFDSSNISFHFLHFLSFSISFMVSSIATFILYDDFSSISFITLLLLVLSGTSFTIYSIFQSHKSINDFIKSTNNDVETPELPGIVIFASQLHPLLIISFYSLIYAHFNNITIPLLEVSVVLSVVYCAIWVSTGGLTPLLSTCLNDIMGGGSNCTVSGNYTSTDDKDSTMADNNSEDKWIELKVQIPGDTSWEKVRTIEDEISEAAGEILESHGLERNSHRRIVKADYTSRADDEE